MKEFGSDFHLVENYNSGRAHLTDVFRNATLLADGRQCIVALIRQYGWRRLWFPEYFCYEVMDSIQEQTGIELITYEDSPLKEGKVELLPFEKGDALLRMNFFGMRDMRSNKNISVPVIEDHSHDPFGHWALYSDADWCISSIRKTLPIPEGGMAWSPKGHVLTIDLPFSKENENIAATRWEGMKMKLKYLQGVDISKEEFRRKYTETEKWFDNAEPALIDQKSREYVSNHFDLNLWLGAKRRNWRQLKEFVNKNNCTVMTSEHESCTMFSLVLLMDDQKLRDGLRKKLIDNCVYPAILWKLPATVSAASKDFSERMISIHCDGRYSDKDVNQLANILNNAIEDL